MIRFISFLTSLVLTMSILAGCGAGDVHFEKESTEEQETIEVTNALADEKVLPYGLSDVTLNYRSSLDKTVDLYFLMELGELRGEKELEDLVNLLDSYASFEQINFKDLSPDENPEIINLLDPDGTYDYRNPCCTVFHLREALRLCPNGPLPSWENSHPHEQPYPHY